MLSLSYVCRGLIHMYSVKEWKVYLVFVDKVVFIIICRIAEIHLILPKVLSVHSILKSLQLFLYSCYRVLEHIKIAVISIGE